TSSVSELSSIYSVLILQDNEEFCLSLRRRKWEQRRKNLRSLMMTWALVFLTKMVL
uniref:Uncharacterized protein n=1 Tax=Mus spicilegus TaxID=10103 RepID=A0A8C6G841_MUSSI